MAWHERYNRWKKFVKSHQLDKSILQHADKYVEIAILFLFLPPVKEVKWILNSIKKSFYEYFKLCRDLSDSCSNEVYSHEVFSYYSNYSVLVHRVMWTRRFFSSWNKNSIEGNVHTLSLSLPFFCVRSRVLLVHLAGGWGGTIIEGNAAKNEVVFTYFSCTVLFANALIKIFMSMVQNRPSEE